MADNLVDPVAYLASKGLQGKQGAGPEVAYPCFFDCAEPPHSTKRKLYVNTETGLYTCFVCGAVGGTYLLQKHFGDEPSRPEPGTDPHTRRKILDWAAEVGSVMLTNNDEALTYLLDRGLSAETIIEAKLGVVIKPWSLVGNLPEEFSRAELENTGLIHRVGPMAGRDFYYSHLLIPYLSRGHVVQIRGREWQSGRAAKYLTPAGDPVLLYGVDDLDDAEDVIITEGEFDRLVVRQHLHTAVDDRARRIAVIGLAGANGFKDGYESYLSGARRIYLGLDPDDTGKREMVKLKDRLGNRARIIELPPELPKCDWSEYLLPVPVDADSAWRQEHPHAGHTWRDIMSLLGNAAGKRLFSVRESGFAYRQLMARTGGIKLGYPEFDAVIGGLRPGQLVVFLAKTGTGKTVFVVNVAWNTRAIPQVIVSLEMTREEVYERLSRIARFHHPYWSDDQVESALDNILICDENRLSEKDMESLLDEFEMERGVRPQLAYVDYLGYYARGVTGNSQYERTTNAVMQLKAMAKAGRIVLISPAQVNRNANEGKPITLDDARDSGAVEETADFLISLYRPDDALTPDSDVPPSGVMKMEILKSRHGGKGRVFNLVFDTGYLAIVEGFTPAAKKAREHNDLMSRGWTYEMLRKQDSQPVQRQMPYKEV
jgi:archaellum biogenesis ATPase FlaH